MHLSVPPLFSVFLNWASERWVFLGLRVWFIILLIKLILALIVMKSILAPISKVCLFLRDAHQVFDHSSVTLPSLTSSPLRLHRRRKSHDGPLVICDIDAAQAYDYELKLAAVNNSYPKLKIAIVGFRNYG